MTTHHGPHATVVSDLHTSMILFNTTYNAFSYDTVINSNGTSKLCKARAYESFFSFLVVERDALNRLVKRAIQKFEQTNDATLIKQITHVFDELRSPSDKNATLTFEGYQEEVVRLTKILQSLILEREKESPTESSLMEDVPRPITNWAEIDLLTKLSSAIARVNVIFTTDDTMLLCRDNKSYASLSNTLTPFFKFYQKQKQEVDHLLAVASRNIAIYSDMRLAETVIEQFDALCDCAYTSYDAKCEHVHAILGGLEALCRFASRF